LDPDQALTVAKQMVASFGPTWVGSRDMQDVEGRLLEKLQSSEDPAKLEAATEMLVELVSITGDAATVIAAADNLVGSRGLDRGLLDPARELASFLSGVAGLQEIDQTWDFGFAPGLAYYTGLVFEVTHPDQPDWPMAGGGRYDGLIKALGGPDLPALGFAYTAESILTVLDRSERASATSSRAPIEAVVVPRGLADSAAVLAEAERLRGPDRSKIVVIHPEPGQIDAAREYAISNGARTFVMVGPEGPHSVSLEDLPS
jgi:histidyl-tRNA synthetase